MTKSKYSEKVVVLRRNPEELGQGAFNPHLPSREVRDAFCLPPGISIQQLKNVALTIDLSTLGVNIPRCTYPDRFEQGFRYGLAHNARTDITTHFRPLFSKGFCWAKMYYRKFDPSNSLAASGSGRGRG